MLDTVDLLVRDAKARFPGAPVFLYGHSMGGAVALIHGLTRSASVAGVIATSPLIRLAGRTPAVKVAAAKLLARVAPSFLMKNPLDLDALSRDQSVAGAVRGDPLYHNIVSTRLGCDIMEWGPWFESQSGPFPLPLLMMSGSQDRIVDTSATSALAGRLTGDVTHKVWEGNYHELHNEPEREEILGFLAQWLKESLRRRKKCACGAGKKCACGAGKKCACGAGEAGSMSTTADAAIRTILQRESARLAGMGEPGVSRRPGPGKWCPKEILGHLVDSGTNNLHRFVRAQLVEQLDFPGYQQDAWVALQDWEHADWQGLVTLWAGLNAHIARVVARIPAAKLATPCRIGGGEPLTLEAVIQGYITHVEHHLAQV